MNRIGILLAAFVANLVLIAGFGAITGLPAGGPTVIDLQLSMSPGVFTQIVDLWGPARVAGVRRSIVLLDCIFPITYAVFISLLYRTLCESGKVTIRRLVVFAP